MSGEPSKKEKSCVLWQKAAEFQTYFRLNRIYFSESTCAKVDSLFKNIAGTSHNFSYWLAQAERYDAAEKKMDEAWCRLRGTMKNDAPLLVAAVEKDFRTILGVLNTTGDQEDTNQLIHGTDS